MSLILAQLSPGSFNTNIFETIYILGNIDKNYASIDKHLVTVIHLAPGTHSRQGRSGANLGRSSNQRWKTNNSDDYLEDTTETNVDDDSEYQSLECTAEDLNFAEERIQSQCNVW